MIDQQPTLEIQITRPMANAFSDLTGDHSPLHVDAQFARRTLYREPIVQGMLVYAFAALLTKIEDRNRILIPNRMKGQFLEPIPMDTQLVMSADCRPSDAEIEYHISVKRKTDKIVVLKGILAGHLAEVKDMESTDAPSTVSATMASDDLQARYRTIDDIQKDDQDIIPFKLEPSVVETLLSILESGIPSPSVIDIHEHKKGFYYPNLAAAMMLSTSVGMFCPGQLATFLDFDIRTRQPLPYGGRYRCQNTVRHVSRSTRMIKNDIIILQSVGERNDPAMAGYVHAVVNLPPAAMPDMEELRSHRELGIENRVALVTGASRGIGETIAKILALHGVKVVVNYFRGRQDAERIVNEITSAGGQAIAVQADVRDMDQVKAMAKRATAIFGTIDILVNNAVGGFKPIAFKRMAWDDVQREIDVVVRGAFNCCRSILPLMAAQNFGKVINVGTVATDDPPANQVKYVVAKSGLVGLTRALSVEYARQNIQINMVVPNFVETDLVAHIAGPYRQKIAGDIPMQRAASPVDIAQTVVYLASAYSSYMTGQKIMVTGGGAPYS